MKKYLLTLLVLFLLIPLNVFANIICNDGYVSKSCGDCHRGCCSGHGGCTSGYSGSYGTQTTDSSYDSNYVQSNTNYNQEGGETTNDYSSQYGSTSSGTGYITRSYDPDKNKSDTPWWGYIIGFLILCSFLPTGGNKKRRRR